MKSSVLLFVVLGAAACSESPTRANPVSASPVAQANQALRLPESDHGGRPLNATLTGAAEVPGPGDPDGTGSATMTTNWGQGVVCYDLTVSDIAPATAAHIHQAPAGEAGPIVFTLTPPTNGSSHGCFSIDAGAVSLSSSLSPQARRIDVFRDPTQYYVNVHNAAFPAGAIRGQLSQPQQ